MSRARILVVEDDVRTADWLALYLERAGHAVTHAADGAAALRAAEIQPPDLVLLDVMLPGLDGFAVCRALRADSPVPIVVLTARTDEADRLRGFELGADDYVTKPFSPREVVARVEAVLRRTRGSGAEADEVLQVGPLELRPSALEVSAGGTSAKLTPIEGRLLEVMMRAPRRGFSRTELVERLGDFKGSARTIDAHIKNLRRKIETLGSGVPVIETLHGVGYRIDGGSH
ncbi:MAG TPA: response regulator transcription factor [Vicinamibacterales bacterium]|nr:response regulator transcription factor [Vicinamibacterales bacterium]